MTAVLRIRDGFRPLRDASAPNPAKEYLDRLVKLVPAEVIGLYLAGKSLIQSTYGDGVLPGSAVWTERAWFWFGWSAACLLAVIWVRAWATSDRDRGVPIEKAAVFIAASSFVFWMLSTGDHITFLFSDPTQRYVRLLPALLVLAWTFIVPFAYRPKTARQVPAPTQMPGSPPPTGGGGGGAMPGPVGGPPPSGTVGAPRSVDLGQNEFPEEYARDAVLDEAAELSSAPEIDEPVSGRFSTASQIRKLLEGVQNRIFENHGVWVTIANGSPSDMEKLGKLSFNELWKWVWKKVLETGAL